MDTFFLNQTRKCNKDEVNIYHKKCHKIKTKTTTLSRQKPFKTTD